MTPITDPSSDDAHVDAPESAMRLGRRGFLAAPALAGLALAVPEALSAAPLAPRGQLRLAVLLTDKADLPAELVKRTFAALTALDPLFAGRAARLMGHIEAAKLRDVEGLRASAIAADAELMATAQAIILALYTGRAGDGAKARCVGFEDTLMYRPTIDVAPVPTYSGEGPGYWAEASATGASP